MNATLPGPVLPAPLRAVASRLPRHASATVFATALNLTLGRKFPSEVFERLEGHTFSIVVDDAGLELAFQVRGGRFLAATNGEEPLLRIRASIWDYAQLVAQNADPDTLFFNRRLLTEGDTELAVLVKNTLDTIDIPRTRRTLKRVLRLLEGKAA